MRQGEVPHPSNHKQAVPRIERPQGQAEETLASSFLYSIPSLPSANQKSCAVSHARGRAFVCANSVRTRVSVILAIAGHCIRL